MTTNYNTLDIARKLHTELCDAMCRADIKTINTLLQSDATLTHMTGYIQTKHEWIAEIRAGTMKYYSIKTTSESVNTNEYVFTTLCDADIWGMRHQWHLGLRYTLETNKNSIAQIQAFA